MRGTRRLRITASAVTLASILACGRRGGDEPPPRVEEAPPAEMLVLPDAVMPLTEGGQVEPREPDVSSVIATFPDGDFAALRARITTWMPAHGWTLVAGSETDGERNARNLEELGMAEAAALARQTPSYGASFQREGATVAVTLDSLSGTLQMNVSWF